MSSVYWFVIPIGILCVLFLPYLAHQVVRKPLLVVSILLLGLPFHTIALQFIRVDLNFPSVAIVALQLWKELLIAILLLLVFVRVGRVGKYATPSPVVFMVCVLFMLWGLTGVFQSPQFSAGVMGWRGTFQPFLFLVVMLTLPLTFSWLCRITPLLIAVGTIVAAFAIFQALVLGYEFVYKYYALDGLLPTSFSFAGGNTQRAMGTFSSPNQLSMYLVFLLLLALNLWLRDQSKAYRRFLLLSSLLMSIALILTVSRSGWVALIAGASVSFLMWRRKSRFIAIGLAVSIFAVPVFLVLGFDAHLMNTFRGNDPSANYRFEITVRNLSTIVDNPLGVGLGVVGARAQSLQATGVRTYSTESYLLQLAMEVGIPGLLFFLTLILVVVIRIYQNIFRVHTPLARGWAVAALSSIFAALAHSIFIPDLQDLTVGIYLCAIMAIGLALPRLENVFVCRNYNMHVPPFKESP